MAESTQSQSVMQVSLPHAGEVAEYQLSADIPVKFNFYVSEVLFSCDGMDLWLTGEDGGTVVLKNYLTLAQEDALPVFELHGGEEVPGNIYLFAFNESALDVETAAGTPGENSEMEEFLDDQIAPGNYLPDSMGGFEESSSLQDIAPGQEHAQGILTYAEIFSDHGVIGSGVPGHTAMAGDGVGQVPTLFGAAPVLPDADLAVCSLVDSYDPIDDVIQHVVEAPYHL